ncbi:MAG: anthranilate synthase component I [bacterium]
MRLNPAVDSARRRLQDYAIVPVYRKFVGDTVTPVSAYLALSDGGEKRGFLLESVEKGDQIARYSFLSVQPRAAIYLKDDQLTVEGELELPDTGDPFTSIQQLARSWDPAPSKNLPAFTGGLVGYFGYETIKYIEPTVPVHQPGAAVPFPDCCLYFVDTTVVFDHVERSIYLVGHLHRDSKLSLEEQYENINSRLDDWEEKLSRKPKVPPLSKVAAGKPEINSNFEKKDFESAVSRVKESIMAGETFQVVLSQRFELEDGNHPFNLYRSLRSLNPSPYMFYLDFEDFQLIGASPEMLVQKQGEKVYTRPIAGTRRRGRDAAEDKALAEDLLSDKKELAEHTMLVDLGRNDLGRVCKPGTVKVTERERIERYSHVMHIVSDVEGEIAEDCDAIDVLKATFPAGTVSGAPKVRAMQIINECEPSRRGPYSGAVCFFSFNGDLNSCIIIRTIINQKDKLYVQAGAGIVADSRPSREYEETREKARALMKAVQTLPTTSFL